jgi:hypothetical protein
MTELIITIGDYVKFRILLKQDRQLSFWYFLREKVPSNLETGLRHLENNGSA